MCPNPLRLTEPPTAVVEGIAGQRHAVSALYILEPFVGLGGPPTVLALFSYTDPFATTLMAAQFKRSARA